MRSSNPVAAILFNLTCLLFPLSVMAQSPSGNRLQQFKLNQSSQLELERIQNTPTSPTTPLSLQQKDVREKLNQQQRLELWLLQENQRREQLVIDQRIRTTPHEPHDRTTSIMQQQRFRQEQHHLLNRFRDRQQIRNWQR